MNTGRLKRKLGDLGVDASSSKAKESFCLIGTPLPSLDKSKDNGEFVPLWKQEVRDEQGRRRLHGAFTGGFSAGYFNTVGSKEGWTPSTFTSSRNARAQPQKTAFRPEDFMDDEDMADRRENQNMVDEADEMIISRPTLSADNTSDPITRALEESMLPSTKDSVGARILKKMGWKLGQGIGPRITLKQRRAQDIAVGIYSVKRDLEDDEEANKHMYAPRDTPLLIVDRKDNSHGIGYTPGMGLNTTVGGNKDHNGPKLSAGFGLGALNDADEDDLDVYQTSSRDGRHLAYDASEKDDDDNIHIRQPPRRAFAQPIRTTKVTQMFHSGSLVASGFILSDEPVIEDRLFPLPELPVGWLPDPKRVWNAQKDKENASQHPSVLHPASKVAFQPTNHDRITAEQRGSILGETSLPAKKTSVFDFMSQKDRERITAAAAAASAILPERMTSIDTSSSNAFPPPPAPPNQNQIVVAHLTPGVAAAALAGFQPFTSDPVKQARYTAYLQSQATPSTHRPPAVSKGQKIADFNKELDDFSKSAKLFRPVSGAMAGRFTSAAVLDMGPNVIEGLHIPVMTEEKPKTEMIEVEKEKEDERPKAHAARMGLYGTMTREITVWMPVKLLCKRFAVKEPELKTEEDPMAAAPTQSANLSNDAGHVPELLGTESFYNGAALNQIGSIQSTTRREKRDLNNVGLGEDDDQGRDTLTYERPAMDVFKAIFESDVESEDEAPVTTSAHVKSAKSTSEAITSISMPAPSLGAKVEGNASQSAIGLIASDASVDFAIFKPTFISRAEREGGTKPPAIHKEKQKKKNGKSAATVTTLSFTVDDETGDDSLVIVAPAKKHKSKSDRPKKKRRKEDKQMDADLLAEDDSVWVEKGPSPAVIADLSSQKDDLDTSAKSRKRAVAIDFM